jgi:hypothetical protein
VRFERRHAWFLIAVAAWNVLTYARFTKALMDDHSGRPTAYFVAHGVLIVVNLLIALVLGRWGWRALQAARQDKGRAEAALSRSAGTPPARVPRPPR